MYDENNQLGYVPDSPDMEDMTEEERNDLLTTHMLFGCGSLAAGFIVALLICWLLIGCTTTRYVEVPVVRTDTVRVNRTERDSIYLRDSIYMKEWTQGDTVYVVKDRWKTMWKNRTERDTIYRSRVDSVSVPVEVAKPLTWWEKTRMRAGEALLVLLVGAVAYGGWRLWRKWR